MVITVAGEKCEVYRLKVSGMVRTFFTRATSQSPCLHETLATAAITGKTRRACFIPLFIRGYEPQNRGTYGK